MWGVGWVGKLKLVLSSLFFLFASDSATASGSLFAFFLRWRFPFLFNIRSPSGFGIAPPGTSASIASALEAMACGTAVIASSRGALPEVVGSAGFLVDPLEVDSIASTMFFLTQDNTLIKNAHVKGLAQSSSFSWEKTAKEIEQILLSRM